MELLFAGNYKEVRQLDGSSCDYKTGSENGAVIELFSFNPIMTSGRIKKSPPFSRFNSAPRKDGESKTGR
jgi:hypothetical protein